MNFFKIFTTALVVMSLAVPAYSSSGSSKSASPYPKAEEGGGRCDPGTSILELILCASGEEGYDGQKQDFDILRDLVITAGLLDAVAGLEGVTVFAPKDGAFAKLAEDLGYDGDYDEGEIVGFLANALSGLGDLEEVLTTVILYHVATKEYTFKRLLKGKTIETVQGGTIVAKPNDKGKRVILEDKEPDVNSPRIHDRYRDLETSQGLVHVITRVLIPLDIP